MTNTSAVYEAIASRSQISRNLTALLNFISTNISEISTHFEIKRESVALKLLSRILLVNEFWYCTPLIAVIDL